MDARLTVNDAVRELSAGLPEDVSLMSIAWRAANEQCRRRREELSESRAQAEQLHQSLASIAQRGFQFSRIVRTEPAAENQSDLESLRPELQTIAQQLMDALASACVSIISPVDEPYTAELMELLENVAQRTERGIEGPRVTEILEPAILYGATLLRMGKAVIAVPENEDRGPGRRTGSDVNENANATPQVPNRR